MVWTSFLTGWVPKATLWICICVECSDKKCFKPSSNPFHPFPDGAGSSGHLLSALQRRQWLGPGQNLQTHQLTFPFVLLPSGLPQNWQLPQSPSLPHGKHATRDVLKKRQLAFLCYWPILLPCYSLCIWNFNLSKGWTEELIRRLLLRPSVLAQNDTWIHVQYWMSNEKLPYLHFKYACLKETLSLSFVCELKTFLAKLISEIFLCQESVRYLIRTTDALLCFSSVDNVPVPAP